MSNLRPNAINGTPVSNASTTSSGVCNDPAPTANLSTN